MPSYFYILTGRKCPSFLVDEKNEPAAFGSYEKANSAALKHYLCLSVGYIIIEMDDNGPVGEVT